ncbi:MAG TPA: DUF5309 domain-containing protein [Sphingomonas sp.]|jgi:hypothetical protein
MAAPTNTLLTFSAVGNREDLLDKIFNISPVDTPFFSMIESSKATATYHEWQTEVLNAAAQNAQIQGDDVTFGSPIITTRVGNRTQIMRKEVIISGTQEAVDKAGRNSEMVRQMANKRKELYRDREFVLLSNQAPVTGNSATAPQLRPTLGWYSTNVNMGSGGANGTTTTARTDGTQRTLTEAMFASGIQSAWTNGGKPSMVVTGPKQRTVIDGFNGGATKFYSIEDKKLAATIQVYEGSFGTVKMVLDRFVRGGQTGADREIQFVDPDLWAFATLRPFQALDIAKTGDSEKGVILFEGTLEARQEAGNALVADLT